MDPKITSTVLQVVPSGTTAVLNCSSNDYNHNFMFWLLEQNKIIGPGNEFDSKKYKYEILSGVLHINNVSPYESGFYRCISKQVDGSEFSVGEVEMFVSGSAFSASDTVKLIAIIISIVVIIGSIIIYFYLRREWQKHDGHSTLPEDEADEEDGDEIYNSTTTTKPMPGPSRNQSSEQLSYGIDNQGLDTDFNSVFENIQIKSPEPSLI